MKRLTMLEAVKQDGLTIEYIVNPSKEVQLAAVKQDGDAIKFIDNPDKEVQLEAIKNNMTLIGKDVIKIGCILKTKKEWLEVNVKDFKKETLYYENKDFILNIIKGV